MYAGVYLLGFYASVQAMQTVARALMDLWSIDKVYVERERFKDRQIQLDYALLKSLNDTPESQAVVRGTFLLSNLANLLLFRGGALVFLYFSMFGWKTLS